MATEYAVPDEGLTNLVKYLVSAALVTDEALHLRLFANDIVPLRSRVLSDYTPATFTGYSERVLFRTLDWELPSVVNHVGVIRSNTVQEYLCTGAPQTIYGSVLFGGLTVRVYYQRRFATPVALAVGTILKVRPVITLQSVAYSTSA